MRIKDYPRTNTVEVDDVILIDGDTGGTRSISVSDLGNTDPGGGGVVIGGTHPIPFTILSSAWQASVTYSEYPFQATLSVPGLVVADLIRADFDLASIIAGAPFGLAPAGATIIDGAVFYAKNTPSVNLTGMYTVFKGGA